MFDVFDGDLGVRLDPKFNGCYLCKITSECYLLPESEYLMHRHGEGHVRHPAEI